VDIFTRKHEKQTHANWSEHLHNLIMKIVETEVKSIPLTNINILCSMIALNGKQYFDTKRLIVLIFFHNSRDLYLTQICQAYCIP
jgi:hypothetical protein